MPHSIISVCELTASPFKCNKSHSRDCEGDLKLKYYQRLVQATKFHLGYLLQSKLNCTLGFSDQTDQFSIDCKDGSGICDRMQTPVYKYLTV